ncbi:MAG: hypothetical protein ABI147_09845, partial [Acidobacteriaceae bacterium]
GTVILSASEGPASSSEAAQIPAPHTMLGDAFERNAHNDRTPPGQGIAPDLAATAGLPRETVILSASEGYASHILATPDRGLYHAADAMKSMYDMGDAPSCSTCGAIMVRNGSCYRCMECGGTSGCS